MKPTVFLVDDDRTFLRSTTRLFESEELPVAAFRSGEEFFENYETGHPGCLLLDLKMPTMNGLEVLDMMRELDVALPTIVMTAFGNVQSAVQAIELCASTSSRSRSTTTQNCWNWSGRMLSIDRVSQKIQQEAQETCHRLGLLTDREREILFHVADGLSSSEIASELNLSLATVNSHRINILKKMEVGSVRKLISLISRYRFVQRPPVNKAKSAVKKRR